MRRLSIPYEWQDATIRAAITLKLSNFEETGGIVAALTTSLPEAPHSGRNWDYRYCWLRDAYFVVRALNPIGATKTMEDFIAFVFSIVGEEDVLKPVYGIVPSRDLTEWIAPDLKGFEGHGPVRIGNAAVDQIQHDAYGSVILSAVPMFFDKRLPRPGGETLFRLVEKMARQCAALALEPDAGIWEYRGRKRIHTHSAAMCWAGLSRTGAIAARLGFSDRAAHWNDLADKVGGAILDRCWNAKRGPSPPRPIPRIWTPASCCCPNWGCSIPPTRVLFPRSRPSSRIWCGAIMCCAMPPKTISACRNPNSWSAASGLSMRCVLGRTDEARDRFKDALALRNHYGLFAEDINPKTGALWGNFPQTYSMAGLILSAMRLSKSWEERYWRG